MQNHHEPGNPFLVPDQERALGWTVKGDLSRLRAALHRYHHGGNLTVAVVGGSIAAGAGAVDAHSWVEWLDDWLAARYGKGGRYKMNNGAVPGTLSSYMSMCHNVHVPQYADVVIVEYALNDENAPYPLFDNTVRRPFERLLRKLLSYPNRPAIILLNAYAYLLSHSAEQYGLFWTGAEREFYEFANYYHLPMLSIKGCCYHLMRRGVHGFDASRPRSDHGQMVQGMDAVYKGKMFYYDKIHPDGFTGHLAMAEVVIEMWSQVEGELLQPPNVGGKPLKDGEKVAIASMLPPPMIRHNYESTVDKCFIGDQFVQSVIASTGWEWKNDSPAKNRPKWGYISTVPGSVLRVRVNTTAANSASNIKQEGDATALPPPPGAAAAAKAMVSMEIAHLKSYTNMGRAEVKCEVGCTCSPSVLDGHQTVRNSQLHLHEMKVTQADVCIIAITVLPETSSGQHKVKVAGVMVSDEGGAESKGFGNWAAVEYVHDAAQGGVFSISNT